MNISKQIEDGNDLRKSNSLFSNSPLSNFEEITFNMQKRNSKQLTNLIPHDNNYYLQPLSNTDIKSSIDNDFTKDNDSQKHSNFSLTWFDYLNSFKNQAYN